jgi:hypothetical protein
VQSYCSAVLQRPSHSVAEAAGTAAVVVVVSMVAAAVVVVSMVAAAVSTAEAWGCEGVAVVLAE